MDVVEEFERRLTKRGKRSAEVWIEEWCEAHPWDQKARACRAFLYAYEERKDAFEELEGILGVSPFDDWALAGLFLSRYPEPVEDDPRFMGPEGFRLEPVWVAKLWVWDRPFQAYSLYLTILLHGSHEQVEFVEEYFGDLPERIDRLLGDIRQGARGNKRKNVE